MANIKIAILDDFEKIAETVPAFAKLKARAEITLLRERLDSSAKIVQRLRDFNALLLMRERTFFSDKEYSQLPNLKFIAQTGRTTKHLDLANATKRGIAIAGTAADNGMSTMELTIALILALLRKIPRVNLRMREELWPAIAGNTLAGKTVGVVGFGRIGKEVARILDLVQLPAVAERLPRELSGGQQQLVGVARAVIASPKVILADEPVASLDPATSHTVLDYLRTLNHQRGVTVLCSLHFLSLAREYGAAVVCMCIDEEGQARTADRKVAIARRIRARRLLDPLLRRAHAGARSRGAPAARRSRPRPLHRRSPGARPCRFRDPGAARSGIRCRDPT